MAEAVATQTGPDPETLAVYDRAARSYATGTPLPRDVDHAADVAAFLARVPKGGRILDLGCGPGHWAARFGALGYVAEATDASAGMAALARAAHDLPVTIAPFDALDAQNRYDGVWANFSLLHAPRAAFPGHLTRIARALRKGGALHLGMKLGTGMARDALGRLFTYYGEAELTGLVTRAGLAVARTRCGNGRDAPGGPDTFVIVTAHG